MRAGRRRGSPCRGPRRGARAGGGRGPAARSGAPAGSRGTAGRLAVSSIVVLSPPWTTAMSHAAWCRSRSGRKPCTSTPARHVERSGVDPRPATTTIRRPGIRRRASAYDAATRRSRWRADAGAADADQTDHVASRRTRGVRAGPSAVRRIGAFAHHVAGEVEVLLGPLARRSAGPARAVGRRRRRGRRRTPTGPAARGTWRRARPSRRCSPPPASPPARRRRPSASSRRSRSSTRTAPA